MPTLQDVSSSTSTQQQSVRSGQRVDFTLSTDENIVCDTAGGTPYLTLNDGGRAAYVAQPDARTLTFSYTIADGENTNALAITGFQFNGSTIRDAAGNSLDLSNLATVPGTSTDITVDTLMPAAVVVVAQTPSGTGYVGSNSSVTFAVEVSEAVSVNTAGGFPFLTLDDGGTATYTGMSDARHLLFKYTSAAGQNTANLAVTGLSTNDGTISDTAGNPIKVSSFTNTQGSATGLVVDTIAPSTTTLAFKTATGTNTVAFGGVVTFTVATDQDIVVNTTNGSPFLTLDDGGKATYAGQQDTQHLVFNYTAATGENTGNLTVTGLTSNGSVIADDARNAVVSTSLMGTPGDATGVVVDTIAPSAISIASTTSTGAKAILAGQTVEFTVAISEAVVVNTARGLPLLTLDDGGTATYAGQRDARNLLFNYTAATGQNTSNLTVMGLAANGSTISDMVGNPVVGDSVVSTQGHITGILVDTTAPSAVLITSTTTTGVSVIGAGQGVTFSVTTSEAVVVNTAGGSPFLTLDDGGTATYAGMSDARHLLFDYSVATGQNTSNLTVTGLTPNGSTISDVTGNAVINGSIVTAQGATTGVAVNTQVAPTAYDAIYRFFNTRSGSHFYTGSSTEEAQIRSTRPDLIEETNSFQAVDKNGPGAEAVYRFFNNTNGEQFLTTSRSEVANVMNTRPDLTYEGPDFYAHPTQQAGDSAVYRFFDNSNGSHLYTTSETERAAVGANPGFVAEGIAFWAPLTKTA